MIIVYLTCNDEEEANNIIEALLEAKLVACVKQHKIHSSYLWQKKINHDEEILLIMETKDEKFDEINELVDKLHSYDQYVLTAVPVTKINHGINDWLNDSID